MNLLAGVVWHLHNRQAFSVGAEGLQSAKLCRPGWWLGKELMKAEWQQVVKYQVVDWCG